MITEETNIKNKGAGTKQLYQDPPISTAYKPVGVNKVVPGPRVTREKANLVGRKLAQVPADLNQNSDAPVAANNSSGEVTSSALGGLGDHLSVATTQTMKAITDSGKSFGALFNNYFNSSKGTGARGNLLGFLPPLLNIFSIANALGAVQSLWQGKPVKALVDGLKGILLTLGAGDARKWQNATNDEDAKAASLNALWKTLTFGFLEFGQQSFDNRGRLTRFTPPRIRDAVGGLFSSVAGPAQDIIKTTFMGRNHGYNESVYADPLVSKTQGG